MSNSLATFANALATDSISLLSFTLTFSSPIFTSNENTPSNKNSSNGTDDTLIAPNIAPGTDFL